MTNVYAPPVRASIFDSLIYTVIEPDHTGDPDTYPNYKFIADIYISDVMVARLKKVPNPDTGVGVFDVSSIVRAYASILFNPNINAATVNVQSILPVSLQVKFGEEYGYVEYYDVTWSGINILFNHYNKQLKDGLLTMLDNFINTQASNMPYDLYTLNNSKYMFSTYFAASTATRTVTVNTSDGSSETFDFSAVENTLHVINFAPAFLNSLSPGLITAATQWYTVQIGDRTRRVNLICEPRFDIYTLHFMTQYGGFETRLFSKVSRNTIDITRKSFGQLDYIVDSSGNINMYNSNNVYVENQVNYYTQFSEKLSLNTDILNDAEYQWLSELVVSPLIYIENGDYFIPVTLTATNYENKKIVNDGLTALNITIEFNKALNSQTR